MTNIIANIMYVFQHVQEEFVQQSDIGLGRGEEGQCGIVFWLDAVSTTFLLEVEQAACTKSQISMCAEQGGGGYGRGCSQWEALRHVGAAQEGGGEGGHYLQCKNEAIQTVSIDRPHAKTDRRLKQLHRIGLSI